MMNSIATAASVAAAIFSIILSLSLPTHVQGDITGPIKMISDPIKISDSGSNSNSNIDSITTLNSILSIQKQYYEILSIFEDEDDEAPPGPFGGWPHTTPFSTTLSQQEEYNHVVEEKMYVQYQEDYFASYGGKDGHGLHVSQIARPDGATTGYYTGVTHFNHVNDPNSVTFLFAAGRHDGGTNTYLTIDTSSSNENPFMGAQESFIDAEDIGTHTWVSAYTVTERDGPVQHYALFSGGSYRDDNGDRRKGPSKLYIYDENPDGTLQMPPVVEWVESTEDVTATARFCLLADLGNMHNVNGTHVSIEGIPDILITGTGGLDIYSTLGNGIWNLVRCISIRDDLPDTDTAALLGVEVLNQYLIIGARTSWRPFAGQEFNAPSLVYDYQKDVIVQKFASNGQTLSVAVMDEKSRVLIGAGGQAGYTGQPNLLFDVHYEQEEEDRNVRGRRFLKQRPHNKKNKKSHNGKSSGGYSGKSGKSHKPTHKPSQTPTQKPTEEDGTLSLVLSDPQLVRGMPLNYTVYESINPTPVSSQEYFVVPSPGTTRTRQVLPFCIDNRNHDNSERFEMNDMAQESMKDTTDLVLEVNSAQTCNIYYRTKDKESASKVMPLPGSEGVYINDDKAGEYLHIYARAGDTLLVGDMLYVILANYNGNNTVYSFSTEVF